MLSDLPEEVKQKLFVVHAAKNAITENDGLKSLDRCDTVRIHLPKPVDEEEPDNTQRGTAANIVNVLDSIQWIGKALSDYELGDHDLPYYLQELSQRFKRQKYAKGDPIVKKDSKMSKLIIVFAGVCVRKKGQGKEQRLMCHEVIGERGLLEATGRLKEKAQHKHDIVAKSPLYTMEISVRKFKQWCTQEIEVGDIMLEALERVEKDKEDDRFVTLFKNESLSKILQRQECVVSGGWGSSTRQGDKDPVQSTQLQTAKTHSKPSRHSTPEPTPPHPNNSPTLSKSATRYRSKREMRSTKSTRTQRRCTSSKRERSPAR